jgi:ribosome recycling factor
VHSTPKTKANNLITEDGQKDFEEEVQTLTNKFT